MKKLFAVAIIVALFVISGCGTGTTKKVEIDSTIIVKIDTPQVKVDSAKLDSCKAKCEKPCKLKK